MKKNKITIAILSCIGIFIIVSLVLLPAKQSRAETLVENSMFYRIYVALKVDQKAAQAWLPTPWEPASVPKGPFKGANLYILFDDKFIMQDGEGKLLQDGTYCIAALIGFGKNQKTGEFSVFVTRIYWPYDDPHDYKNGIKATISREATIKGSTSKAGSGSEVWKVRDSSGGILEFQMDYQRAVPKRQKFDFKVRSNIKPDFFRTYKDDCASDLVKSIPAGVNRIKNYKLHTTISELSKMFDGSEQLVGISVNHSRIRQVFLP